MDALSSISSDLAAKVSSLKKAAGDLRQATTTNAKIEAIINFGPTLDAIYGSEEAQNLAWSYIRSLRLWEGLIDVLTEAPDITDHRQHKNEVMIRWLCATYAGKLVLACQKCANDPSATAYLRTQLPKILQHQAWLSINTRRWKDTLYKMRQSILHLLCLVFCGDQDLGENKHEIAKGLDREMYLSLVFSHVLDPHTYTLETIWDGDLKDMVVVLMALCFDNQLSGRAASWAVTRFGPSLVCSGFFKFSQLIIKSAREDFFLAPLALGAHLLASTDNHNYMVDKQNMTLFCMDMYWSVAKRDPTIEGTAVAEYSSMIAYFIHAVLDVVKDPPRRNAMMRDFIKEADLVICWVECGFIHGDPLTVGANIGGGGRVVDWDCNLSDIWIATIGKRIAIFAVEDPMLTQEYIKPAWAHVQRCLESCDRIKNSSGKPSTRALDRWTAHFSRHLGWVAASDSFLQTDDLGEVELVG
ncbi:hypothetical protein FS837_012434, partial [Tulasnella sp. UAMH 9824]